MVNAVAGNDDLTPAQVDALRKMLEDPAERLRSLYWIITKGEDDGDLSIRFSPNEVQQQLMRDLWHRNLVLKARQRGITTLMSILWLDTALFSKSPIFCGVVAHEREAAEEIFRTKVVYAYEHLPAVLRERFPLAKKTATSLVFGHNGATIRVATSMRSGTIHRLHVSELGKIAAKYPAKAREVLTGSVPAVPSTGILVVESTAEGQQGAFFDLSKIAQATDETGRELSEKDYRFHFYSWWDADEYEIDPALVTMTAKNHEYFRKVEALIGREIPLRKRAWYVATLESDFAGEEPLMWQEYPSYPDEAFAVSIEGCYYAAQLATARKQGRVVETLPDISAPVNTFWDIGKGDMTCIWFHQKVQQENWFIHYYEASGEDLDHYAQHLQDTKYIFGTHYLPHEAAHKRIGKDQDNNKSTKEILEELMPGQKFEVVPRVTQLISGINSTRRQLSTCRFSEQGCRQGLKRLGGYRKGWDKTRACWTDNHVHNDDSHGADAFRQFGQVADAGETFAVVAARETRRSGARRPSNWRL
jgi:hypothetical protein